MSLMIGAVVIVIIVAGAAFFMSGKSGAKNTAQSETQEKKGSEGKETAVVQEKAESADKSQSAEAREKKAKTESVLDFPDLNSALLLGFYIGGTSCLFFKKGGQNR